MHLNISLLRRRHRCLRGSGQTPATVLRQPQRGDDEDHHVDHPPRAPRRLLPDRRPAAGEERPGGGVQEAGLVLHGGPARPRHPRLHRAAAHLHDLQINK